VELRTKEVRVDTGGQLIPAEEVLFVLGLRTDLDTFLLVSVIAQRLYIVLRNEVGAGVRPDSLAAQDGLIPCVIVSRDQGAHACEIMADRYYDDVNEEQARRALQELQYADFVELAD